MLDNLPCILWLSIHIHRFPEFDLLSPSWSIFKLPHLIRAFWRKTSLHVELMFIGDFNAPKDCWPTNTVIPKLLKFASEAAVGNQVQHMANPSWRINILGLVFTRDLLIATHGLTFRIVTAKSFLLFFIFILGPEHLKILPSVFGSSANYLAGLTAVLRSLDWRDFFLSSHPQ